MINKQNTYYVIFRKMKGEVFENIYCLERQVQLYNWCRAEEIKYSVDQTYLKITNMIYNKGWVQPSMV